LTPVANINGVRSDRRFADNRAWQRNRSGAEAGAVTGGMLGLLLGSLVPGVGSLVGVALAIAFGAGAGALAGRALVTGASVDDWDRNPSDRPYVGAHAPDDEGDPDQLLRNPQSGSEPPAMGSVQRS
jgi:hypothetical protein